MDGYQLTRSLLVLCSSLSLFACGNSTESPQASASAPVVEQRQEEPLIGGVEAFSRKLNAVGTVGTLNSEGRYERWCTASLIGPRTVLTARHCVIMMSGPLRGHHLVDLMPVYFAVGPDARSPERLVEAIAADLSPVNQGGFLALGNDVAVYHLAAPIDDVEPLKVAEMPLREEDIGKRYTTLGYGVKDNDEDVNGPERIVRRMGQVTLRALQGRIFKLMFGSFDAMYSELVEVYGPEEARKFEADMRDAYKNLVLVRGYEAWLGHLPGDVQTCRGDSGGPLLGKVAVGPDGKLENQLFGVVSGSWFSNQLRCDYGMVYATIGPRTREFIARAYQYQDPCVGLTVRGTCDGTIAIRCSDKGEGARRVFRMDCADVDMVCAPNPAGVVGCVDPDEVVNGVGGQVTTRPALPTFEQLRQWMGVPAP
jgi:hypothetical protein